MRFLGKIKYILIMALALGFGLAREILIASHYGLSAQLDAYAAVLGFYIFFGNQIANTLETTFISRYAHEDTDVLVNKLFGAQLGLLIVISTLCVALYFLADQLVGIVFKFESSQLALSAKIIRLFIPAMFLASFIGLFRAVLNIKGIYAPGFFYGSVVSLSVIVVMLLFYNDLGIYALPLGYAIGNFFTLLLFIYYLFKKVAKNFNIRSIKITKPFSIWLFAILVLIAEVIFQCSYLTERSIASRFGEGSVSAYFYAVSILMVFSALIIQPVSTIVFPVIARKRREDAKAARIFVLRVCLVMSVLGGVAACIMFYLSPFVVEVLLVRGNFSHDDAMRTSALLKIMVFILPFMSVSRVIKNSLYSKGSYRLPIFSNLVCWLSLFVSAPFFIEQYGIEGLAMAYVLSTALVPLIMSINFFSTAKKEVVS